MTTRQLKIRILDPNNNSKNIYINYVNTEVSHELLRQFALKTVNLTINTYIGTEIIETTPID